MAPGLQIPYERVVAFCAKWRIQEFSLFGSVLRDDFGPESDVDVLVSFAPDARWNLWDLGVIREELTEILGREVDLVEREALRNPYRRRAILNNREVVHAAGA
jgi:uncharacterized protein